MHVDGMWRIGKPQSLYAGAGPNVYYTAFGQNLLVAERTKVVNLYPKAV